MNEPVAYLVPENILTELHELRNVCITEGYSDFRDILEWIHKLPNPAIDVLADFFGINSYLNYNPFNVISLLENSIDYSQLSKNDTALSIMHNKYNA